MAVALADVWRLAADGSAPAVRRFCGAPGLPKSNIQFNGAGGSPTYISFTQGADDMRDHDEWTSYSHWGMFLTRRKYSN
jgi:hypothetical protein